MSCTNLQKTIFGNMDNLHSIVFLSAERPKPTERLQIGLQKPIFGDGSGSDRDRIGLDGGRIGSGSDRIGSGSDRIRIGSGSDWIGSGSRSHRCGSDLAHFRIFVPKSGLILLSKTLDFFFSRKS